MTVNKRNKWITSLGASLLAISLVAGMGVNLPNAKEAKATVPMLIADTPITVK